MAARTETGSVECAADWATVTDLSAAARRIPEWGAAVRRCRRSARRVRVDGEQRWPRLPFLSRRQSHSGHGGLPAGDLAGRGGGRLPASRPAARRRQRHRHDAARAPHRRSLSSGGDAARRTRRPRAAGRAHLTIGEDLPTVDAPMTGHSPGVASDGNRSSWSRGAPGAVRLALRLAAPTRPSSAADRSPATGRGCPATTSEAREPRGRPMTPLRGRPSCHRVDRCGRRRSP